MRKLYAAGSEVAQRAIDLFIYRIATEAGAMTAALGGLDGFVFTGGIGEHDAAVRRSVVDRLSWLGLSLGPNAPNEGLVSPKGAPVEVWVTPTDEESVIARQTRAIIDSA